MPPSGPSHTCSMHQPVRKRLRLAEDAVDTTVSPLRASLFNPWIRKSKLFLPWLTLRHCPELRGRKFGGNLQGNYSRKSKYLNTPREYRTLSQFFRDRIFFIQYKITRKNQNPVISGWKKSLLISCNALPISRQWNASIIPSFSFISNNDTNIPPLPSHPLK